MINVPAQQPAVTPDEIAWSAARRLGGGGKTLGYAELSAAAQISYERAVKLVRKWREAGLVELVTAPEERGRHLFRVFPGVAVTLRIERTPEQNMWTALRNQGAVSPVDLASLADTDTVRVSVEAARAYCQMLTRGGYLRVMRKAEPAKGIEARYRLVMNTGPAAPRLRRVPAIHDPNKGTITPIGGVA
jgi:hypothetical protein